MRYIFICLTLILISTGAMGAPRRFKCPAVPEKEAVAIKKAGRFFTVGEKLALKAQYPKSMQRYLCSLKMKEHPNTMFNIAQVAKLSENKAPILKQLKQFREQNPEHAAVPEISRLIEKMEAGDYESINPELATPAKTSPPPPKNKPTAPSPEMTEPETPTPDPIPASTPNRLRKMKIFGIVAIAGGAAFTIAGIGFAAGSAAAKNNGLSATEYSDYTFYENQHKGFAVVSVISFIVGAAGITTGTILLLKRKKQMSESATTEKQSLTLTPTGFQISF
jgi:hypothetical protein